MPVTSQRPVGEEPQEWTATPSPAAPRSPLGWIVAGVALAVLVLLTWHCIRKYRTAKQAKRALQDRELNLPIAMPCPTTIATAVPFALVVDVAATAPDHDELLPATLPEDAELLRLQQR